jgi:hypothetical protein
MTGTNSPLEGIARFAIVAAAAAFAVPRKASGPSMSSDPARREEAPRNWRREVIEDLLKGFRAAHRRARAIVDPLGDVRSQ